MGERITQKNLLQDFRSRMDCSLFFMTSWTWDSMSGTQLNGNNSYAQPSFQGSQDGKYLIIVQNWKRTNALMTSKRTSIWFLICLCLRGKTSAPVRMWCGLLHISALGFLSLRVHCMILLVPATRDLRKDNSKGKAHVSQVCFPASLGNLLQCTFWIFNLYLMEFPLLQHIDPHYFVVTPRYRPWGTRLQDLAVILDQLQSSPFFWFTCMP